ncbi:MAG: hypothetical protein ACHQF2_07940 [Flavobacteriales bacterium]
MIKTFLLFTLFRCSVLWMLPFSLFPNRCFSQDKIQWIESFQGRQPTTLLKSKQYIASTWGIDYSYKEFYGDSLQCRSFDSLQWIHNRYFKANQKNTPQFVTVHETMSKLHGATWLQVFTKEVNQHWRSRFLITANDSATYPYSKNSYNYYDPYCSDSVQRGCIDLNTLKFDENKIVPANNFVSLWQDNAEDFPVTTGFKIIVAKKKKEIAIPPCWFLYTEKGKEYKIPLNDSMYAYYNDSYYGNLSVTVTRYKNLVVFLTQPLHTVAKEIIVLNPENKKIIKRIWVGPADSTPKAYKGYVLDQVCAYKATTTASLYKNRFIIDINVECDEHSYRDALHVVDLDSFDIKQFGR